MERTKGNAKVVHSWNKLKFWISGVLKCIALGNEDHGDDYIIKVLPRSHEVGNYQALF